MNQQRKTVYGMRKQVLAAGAGGQPLVEYIEKDPLTRKKERVVRDHRLGRPAREGA